jgi:4-hydroxybenzoate polyprenyltransferase
MPTSHLNAQRWSAYYSLLRLDKPVGTLLLLWPTLAALCLAANGAPSLHLVAVFCLGTLLMRSAGCAINDVADRDIDRHVKRTAGRPLASGVISVKEALVIGALLALAAFGLVLTTNVLTIALSFSALAIACAYPYTKRWLALPQAYLGVAFSFGIPMAFAAASNDVPLLAWWLLVANLFWVMAYDTEYAMVDRDDDLALGIKTSAITFGRYDVAIIMACYALHLAMWAAAFVELGFTRLSAWPAWLGLAVAAGVAAYHYTLIRQRGRDGCFAAFRHNHWLGLAVLLGVVGTYAVRSWA